MENVELRNFREKHSRTPVQSDRQLRDLIANYYGMIALIDHNVGRILAALDTYGLAENTLVVYSTDHGDWLGDHGLILKGPMAYEGLLRVGLLMRGPGIPRGKVVTHPAPLLRAAESHLGLPAGSLEAEPGFRCRVTSAEGASEVFLARFVTTDPPFEKAADRGGTFINLTQARGLPAVELALLRRAYELILG
jgi:hypothetical protein